MNSLIFAAFHQFITLFMKDGQTQTIHCYQKMNTCLLHLIDSLHKLAYKYKMNWQLQ